MLKLFLKLRKNNKGSSLIVALVAITFIGILSTIVITSTMTNYKLRSMNLKSKKTFYSAESALEEIYSGLGDACYKALDESYRDTLTYASGLTNADANANLKARYMNRVKGLTSAETGAWLASEEDCIKFLNSFIEFQDNAEVLSVDISKVNPSALPIVISDVVIRYRDSINDFSTVCVDLRIGYPDVNFNFINDSNTLKSYLDYALIAMEGIQISSSKVISGGVFAGSENNRVNVSGLRPYGGNVVFNNNVDPDSHTKIMPLIVDGDIHVHSGMTVGNEKVVWANNINVGEMSTTPITGTLTYDGINQKTYMADDLNIDGGDFGGTGSKVTLAGSLYGFGKNLSAKGSSAIVVNGYNSSIDLSPLALLQLAGVSYIDVGNLKTDYYRMGDSTGIKGVQRIYLVPSSCTLYGNPSNRATDVGVSDDALDKYTSKFPGVNFGTPAYEVINSGNGFYSYLRFASNADRVKFVDYIASYGGTDTDILNLKSILQNDTKAFLSLLKVPGGNSLTVGKLYSYSGSGSVNVAGGGNYGAPEAENNKYANMYLAYKQFLDCGSAEKITTPLKDGDLITITNADDSEDDHAIDLSRTIYDYVLDTEKLKDLPNTEDSEITNMLKEDKYGNVAVVTAGTSITLTGKKKGVVLAYDADVTVEGEFEGMIITNKAIMVRGSGSIKANHDIADKTIKNSPLLSKYFIAYQGASSEIDPTEIEAKDFIKFTDWRKNYVYKSAKKDSPEPETT